MRLGCETGAEKPSLHDADGDGSSRFSGSGLHALSVRQDADTNGVADPGEVKSVRSLGITSIALSDRDDLTGSFEMNGKTYKTWDWWPNAFGLVKVASKWAFDRRFVVTFVTNASKRGPDLCDSGLFFTQ